jgi:lipopolysaccharide/colanic/teichoic acid biosynthesis glycosyltransferase
MRQDSDPATHRAYYAAFVRGEAPAFANVFKLRLDHRITPLGRLLRRLSLDELPQLFNVAQGSMSLVGPRPPLPYEVALYGRREYRRLSVPPGLTGLWQVSGRATLTFGEMIDLDLAYVDQWSLWLDLQMLARTPAAVLAGRGAC